MEKFKGDLGVAVSDSRGPEMHLEITREVFYPLSPDPDMIDIRDIAHATARQCRYNGNVKVPHYSVAHHMLLVSELLRDWGEKELIQFCGLLHDAAEAYTGDLTRPMKLAMRAITPPGQKMVHDTITEGIEAAIAKRFRLPNPMPKVVKEADVWIAAIEKKYLLTHGKAKFTGLPDLPPNVGGIFPMGPLPAERLYLKRFVELGGVLVP